MTVFNLKKRALLTGVFEMPASNGPSWSLDISKFAKSLETIASVIYLNLLIKKKNKFVVVCF